MNTRGFSWFYSRTANVPVNVLNRVGFMMSQRNANTLIVWRRKPLHLRTRSECLHVQMSVPVCLSVCHYQSWYISWTLTFQHFHPVTKLIRCDDVKQCPARKGIALRSFHFPLPLSFLLACSVPTIIFLSCLETVHPLLRPLARPVPCSNIRLSKDVHGGDWSWKSLILGEKETDRQTDRNIVVLISSANCSVIYVMKLKWLWAIKPYHAHQNSDVTGIRR